MGSKHSVFVDHRVVDPLVRMAGLTDGEFARLCDLPPGTYAHMRRGRGISADNAAKLSRGLVKLRRLPGFQGLAPVLTSTPPPPRDDGQKRKVPRPGSGRRH